MYSVLSDLIASWRWQDYIRMGKGIEERHHRCRSWWEPHIALTKNFIRVSSRESRKVAVLGAGRLIDLDILSLLESSDEVHLFDCDPKVVDSWARSIPSKVKARVHFRIEDITSCMSFWTKVLRSRHFVKNAEHELLSLLAPTPPWVDGGFDGIISLNLLGQIPLYWRDRVLSRVRKPSPEILLALEQSMATLQIAHLLALRDTSASWTSVISDTEYYYYTCEKSEWDVEPALFGGAVEAWQKYGRSSPQDCWLWHLAPQFLEIDKHGEIHRVEAKSSCKI